MYLVRFLPAAILPRTESKRVLYVIIHSVYNNTFFVSASTHLSSARTERKYRCRWSVGSVKKFKLRSKFKSGNVNKASLLDDS